MIGVVDEVKDARLESTTRSVVEKRLTFRDMKENLVRRPKKWERKGLEENEENLPAIPPIPKPLELSGTTKPPLQT